MTTNATDIYNALLAALITDPPAAKWLVKNKALVMATIEEEATAAGQRVHRVLATADRRHVIVEGTIRKLYSGKKRVYIDKADGVPPPAFAVDQSVELTADWVPTSWSLTYPPLPAVAGPSENLVQAMNILQATPTTDNITMLRHLIGMFEHSFDLPPAERASIYGLVYAMETGRLDGSVHTALNRASPARMLNLIAEIAQTQPVMGDVPYWLNKHAAEITERRYLIEAYRYDLRTGEALTGDRARVEVMGDGVPMSHHDATTVMRKYVPRQFPKLRYGVGYRIVPA